jgi:uncharacterized membrane protein SirB2
MSLAGGEPPVIEHHEQIRILHVAAALASGGLFALRGAAMWSGSTLGMAAPVRYLSYAIDTLLLGAALTLATLLHRVPLVDPWITAKLALVLAYILLGSLALKRAPTRRARRACLLAALLVFGAILWVAVNRGSTLWAGGVAP